MLDSSWCEKYKPKLSEIKDNQEVVEKLKIMIKTKLWTNFVLRGPVGCGKRTLINAFMNEVGCSDDNILRIYHSNLKIHDTRNLFSNFLEKKTDEKHKWIIIQNIRRFPIQFHYALYNLFTMKDLTVIIVETKENMSVGQWCIIFNMRDRTSKDYYNIARHIEKKEKKKWSKKFLQNIYSFSRNNLYTFLYLLQCPSELPDNYNKQKLPYNELLNHPSLRERYKIIHELEIQGYSHLDIVTHIYNYLRESDDSSIEYVIEVGRTLAIYSNHDYNKLPIYACFGRFWEMKYRPKN